MFQLGGESLAQAIRHQTWGQPLSSSGVPVSIPVNLSTPVENSSFRRLKIPQPLPGGGLQFEPVG